MLSHDPVRTRLREALERSEAGKFLRGARALWADSWSRGRGPTKAEVRGLEARGNVCADWNGLRILGKGPLDEIHGCRFEGRAILRLDRGAPRLRDSTIRDCLIGAATVESVAVLSRAIVDDGAVLRHVGEFAGAADSRFCLGLAVHPGDETGSRRVFLADGLLLADCAAMAALPPDEQEALAHEWAARLRPCVSDHAFVGKDARIEHARFVEDCFVGAGAVIRGAAALRRCVIGSPGGDPARAGDGVIAEDCVLEAGVRLESAAQARRALFLEHSGAEQGAHVADSVIGPNTVLGKGEVTASLVGPFVGFHHQALLIGALWPEGRGNVGYGANVGSNHTGRKPDQELRPGEGAFFGLDCSIKFPADFSEAPYSLFATGVVAPPQKISFPFSLVAPGNPSLHPHLNEILLGWMWGENTYALIRNAYKYADRNRARRHALAEAPPSGSPLAGTFLAADLFAPRIAGCVKRALAALAKFSAGNREPLAKPRVSAAEKLEEALADQNVSGIITERMLPGLGKNFARAERLARARAAYENYLGLAFFRNLLWDAQLPKEAKTGSGTIPDAERLFREFGDAVEASLRKDAERGGKVFGDYGAFHPAAGNDVVCRRLRADLDALLPVLRKRLGAPPALP